MEFSEIALMEGMTPDQRILFHARYSREVKNPRTAAILALLLGGVGAHRFYLGEVGLGLVYLIFCWTFLPAIIALFESFTIGRRVRRFNDRLAADMAARVKMVVFTASQQEAASPAPDAADHAPLM